MSLIQATAAGSDILTAAVIRDTLERGLAGHFRGQRLLVLIPDHTRTIPLPFLFRELVRILADTRQLDFMVALGTHPPLPTAELNQLVGISAEERSGIYSHIGLLNHSWDSAADLQQISTLTQAEIQAIAGDAWHETLGGDVPVRINRRVFAYDHILILGPTFPHEVAGFSGGAKYLFPGISGPEMINVSHWLGALVGVVGTIGIARTPTRAMIEAAAARLTVPVTLAALVVVATKDDPAGLAYIAIGDLGDAWESAAAVSSQRHITWCDKPYQRILSCAPPMYDELWTAGKAMYKLEPALAKGGELIIYAPHLSEVSLVHGQYIYEVGYHVLPYFLHDWDQFKHVPLGVLAHSTHVRGGGKMVNGREAANVTVKLATRLGPAECAQLNLGYVDPASINPAEWANREDDGVLYVPKAGEMLYRVR